MGDPIVSVCCIAYNHALFIRDSIEGFLKQKTDFPIEIIIHDDGSEDATAEIIGEYESRYPELIVAICQKENQYSKGRRILPEFVFPKARGKYIALCEGDDYWTDPNKLQKQVDFLEANSDCIACHHWQHIAVQDENGKYILKEAPKSGHGYFPFKKSGVEQVFKNEMRVKLRTIMFRNVLEKFPEWFYLVKYGDVPLSMILGKYGKFGFIDEPMAVYRQTGQGVSTQGSQERMYTFRHYIEWIKVWEYGNNYFEGRYQKEAVGTIRYFYGVILSKYAYSFKIFLMAARYAFLESRLPLLPRCRILVWLAASFTLKRVRRIAGGNRKIIVKIK